ncbi:hypothetical protein L210DRAFT_3570001 [Boletus edulis BED1]|uniref:Uncharacterized protein n=1 Tax=Boletus edulis BED1 TaxID=1328754 RepID=A0AAD4BF08_BOLED|nr:hypothetical protein L210DRAFT_3570001 [Boletus edulis BED1]
MLAARRGQREGPGDVITYPLPDVALPLPPRPIDTFVECTSTTENTRLPVGTVPITGGATQSLH